MNMFIDDIRVPSTEEDWVIIRSYAEAVTFLDSSVCPGFISFDHDLGIGESGLDIAKYLVEKDLNHDMLYINDNFRYNVHSANPVGRKNIESYLGSYMQFKRGVLNGEENKI
jgi:hypothetical protein